MKNLQMFCLSLNPQHKNLIETLGYIPVGLGNNFFPQGWLEDKSNINISSKNKFYGEYTFHFWLWKNYKFDFDGWIGFCQYRKFWKENSNISDVGIFKNFKNTILKEIPESFNNYETIIGEELFINQSRFSKFIKLNFKNMIRQPSFFFNKNKRNIKFHFDMMHGHGNLDKAIAVLDKKEKKDFNDFVNTEVSFNPHNMFICKNKNILYLYYESLFPWLLNCEKIFGFNDLKGFGLQRLYGFLAERYMSYWFKKYTKYKILPIQFKDISDFLL